MERTLQGLSKSIRAGKFTERCQEFSLEKGEFYRLKVRDTPIKVSAREGVLWVTREHDWEDYLLHKNQSVEFASPGMVVIEAMQDGKVCITS